jgi:hypothetical protein
MLEFGGQKMQIFQQEYDDGVADSIIGNKSLSFASVAEPLSVDSVSKQMKAIAAIKDKDMYYVQSILVSSNWNKNDDIFDPYEIWKAKETPEHKPTNLNHDENLIVGHIISNYPITEDGILIDKNTPSENLPKNFHILTGAVIYKAYTDPHLKDRTRDLIASIEDGTKYVSMECYFDNFDYGIEDPATGSYKVVARDNDSAYLTKYLKAYGGTGEKDNYKIGRVLRNITFSGKGYVDKPANVNSIILQTKLENFDDMKKDEIKNTISENKGVSLDYVETQPVEACIMSKQEELETKTETEVAEEQVVACEAETTETVEAPVEATEATEVSETVQTEEIPSLEQVQAELDEKTSVVAELQTKLEESEAAMKKYMAEKEEDKKKLDEAEAAMKKMEEEVKSMKKKELMAKRCAALAEVGFEDSDIEESIAAYSALDDEAFDAVVAVYKKKMAKMEEKKEEEKEEVKAEETAADTEFDTTEEILEEVQETEALDLTVGGEDDSEANTTSAALIDFVYSRLGKKLNKGE